MKNTNNLLLGVLIAGAILLGVAHLQLTSQSAQAGATAVGRDFQLVTARVTRGEGLYVLDNRTGLVALFTWDAAAKRAVAKDIRPMAQLMGGQ